MHGEHQTGCRDSQAKPPPLCCRQRQTDGQLWPSLLEGCWGGEGGTETRASTCDHSTASIQGKGACLPGMQAREAPGPAGPRTHVLLHAPGPERCLLQALQLGGAPGRPRAGGDLLRVICLTAGAKLSARSSRGGGDVRGFLPRPLPGGEQAWAPGEGDATPVQARGSHSVGTFYLGFSHWCWCLIRLWFLVQLTVMFSVTIYPPCTLFHLYHHVRPSLAV